MLEPRTVELIMSELVDGKGNRNETMPVEDAQVHQRRGDPETVNGLDCRLAFRRVPFDP
jgi:hypothetical protein